MTEALRRTPLAERNIPDGVELIDVYGFAAPLLVTDPVEEHRAVRECVGVLDFSMLLKVDVRGPGAKAAVDAAEARAAEEKGKKEELRQQAEADQKTYDALNYRDDQFDLSDALLALAISMLAVTTLTNKPWMYWLALVPTALGVLMGLAGLAGWHIHPDALSSLLS